MLLAGWAAIAIENARLYRDVRRRRDELERTVTALETTTAIARAVGGETDLQRILELIAKRGRALVAARAMVIELVPGAGPRRSRRSPARSMPNLLDDHIPIEGSLGGQVLRSRRAERLSRRSGAPAVPARRADRREDGSARAAGVPRPGRGHRRRLRPRDRRPRVHRGGRATHGGVRRQRRDRGGDRPDGGDAGARAQRRGLRARAPPLGAASCTTTACRSSRPSSCDSARWRAPSPRTCRTRSRRPIEHVDASIQAMRSLITDMRPASLDQLGVAAGAGGARERWSALSGVDVEPRRRPAVRGRRQAETRLAPRSRRRSTASSRRR